MNKPGPLTAKPLAAILGRTLDDAFARQGFASRELVLRWAEIMGAEIAAHAEPVKIQWPRPVGDAPPEPATLVLRVEGPTALEIQHAADVIVARVNRFLGWNAIGRIALRQAPLRHRETPAPPAGPPAAAIGQVEATLGDVADDNLRAALARLGASVKKT
ncbi:MAG: DUF721 domain-containing protein [Xanthobacteraceae bacterium]|nr:MAG: DUF721 domain-containing protein [Xanthobacteraceae bacterium]